MAAPVRPVQAREQARAPLPAAERVRAQARAPAPVPELLRAALQSATVVEPAEAARLAQERRSIPELPR